ncbi:MAG: transposase [Calothrix sp. MO_192.B10]|nr:transposase [Calothrix sp. MO_192.B10]
MKYNPYIYNRQSIRLREYDYSQPGAYFITICTQHKECNLGELINGEIQFTVRGMIASVFWLEISHHFPNVELDQFILMPNHIHGIIFIGDKNIAENPTMGGETPIMGGETPPLRKGKTPIMGGETSTMGGETSTMGGETSTMGGETSTMGGETPIMGGETPTMGGETPAMGGETPTMGGETPTMGGETPPLRKGKTTLGQIVAYYKYRTTKIINQIDETPGQRIWQRNFYDRIIRTEKALHIMRQYIATNPQRWNKDLYNPRRGGVSPPF